MVAGSRISIPKAKDGKVGSLRVLRPSRASAVRERTGPLELLRNHIVSTPEELRDQVRNPGPRMQPISRRAFEGVCSIDGLHDGGAVKAQLRQELLTQVRFDPAISIPDSFPMPVCRFGRAYRCRRLAVLAACGRDEGTKQTF
jgi:hypothetical protein